MSEVGRTTRHRTDVGSGRARPDTSTLKRGMKFGVSTAISRRSMSIRRLRLVTILAPMVFLVGLEALGLFVFHGESGVSSLLGLSIILLLLAAAVIPFSLWIFAIIGQQQQELARHNAQLGAVNEAIRSISSAIELESVLQKITDAARDVVRSRYAALGVADEHGRLQQFITSGLTSEQRVAIGPLPVGHGLLGALIQDARPLRIREIARDSRSHGFPSNHPPMTSLLGVPIVFNGKPVGDLYLTDKVGAEEFSHEDEELLILLANHAAVAIENARLYEDARQARDRLQDWNEELEKIIAERTSEIQRYVREMTTRVLAAQEEERKRIARELHDDTAQSLSTLMIALDLVEPNVPADAAIVHSGLERIRTIAKRTLDEVRALSHDLRPTILDDFGLIAALRWYSDEFFLTYGHKVDVSIEPSPQERLPPEVELVLFRIAQEALTNSGKYAKASRTSLSLSFPDHVALLEVRDNGQGFDLSELNKPSKQGGFGMYGMRERAELLDASLSVDTAPGRGTRVSVSVPLQISEDTEHSKMNASGGQSNE